MSPNRAIKLRNLLNKEMFKAKLFLHSDKAAYALAAIGVAACCLAGEPRFSLVAIPLLAAYLTVIYPELLHWHKKKITALLAKIDQELKDDEDEVSGIRIRIKHEGPPHPISKRR